MFEQTTKHCSGTATTKLFDMIEYIRGELAELTPAAAIIDCNGVGYLASISLNTYSAIQGKKSCKLYVYVLVCSRQWEKFLMKEILMGVNSYRNQ